MRPQQGRQVIALVALGIGGVGLALPLLSESQGLGLLLYLLATTMATFELADVSVRVLMSRDRKDGDLVSASVTPAFTGAALEPYALVMSVHDIRYSAADVLERLEPYRAQTWIVDDGSTDETALWLRSAGWRCMSSSVNRKKPGAIKLLLERLPKEIKTVVVLDPDCAPLAAPGSGRSLERAIERVQKSGVAACCPRIRYREDGPLVSLQMLECEFAFSLGRKGLSPHCITSGVSIYDRSALENALRQHSLSVYAEDLENSIVLLQGGLRISFDQDLIVETEGKSTPRSWFSQRVGWSYGLARVYAARWREILEIGRRSPWAFYNFVVYVGGLGIALFPVKAAGIFLLGISFINALDNLFAFDLIADNALTNPAYFSATYVTYTVLVAGLVVFFRPPARPTTLVTAVVFYFFYAIANSVATGVGYLNWISVRLTGRRVFLDHYSADCASLAELSKTHGSGV